MPPKRKGQRKAGRRRPAGLVKKDTSSGSGAAGLNRRMDEVIEQIEIVLPEVTARVWKRDMGTDRIWQVGNRRFTPQELSALVLRSLKAEAVYVSDEGKKRCWRHLSRDSEFLGRLERVNEIGASVRETQDLRTGGLRLQQKG